MQVAIAQINEQIGAAGVVNHECKQVVAGYGLEMLELLKALVRANYVLETFVFLTSNISATLLANRMHSDPIE